MWPLEAAGPISSGIPGVGAEVSVMGGVDHVHLASLSPSFC